MAQASQSLTMNASWLEALGPPCLCQPDAWITNTCRRAQCSFYCLVTEADFEEPEKHASPSVGQESPGHHRFTLSVPVSYQMG